MTWFASFLMFFLVSPKGHDKGILLPKDVVCFRIWIYMCVLISESTSLQLSLSKPIHWRSRSANFEQQMSTFPFTQILWSLNHSSVVMSSLLSEENIHLAWYIKAIHPKQKVKSSANLSILERCAFYFLTQHSPIHHEMPWKERLRTFVEVLPLLRNLNFLTSVYLSSPLPYFLTSVL